MEYSICSLARIKGKDICIDSGLYILLEEIGIVQTTLNLFDYQLKSIPRIIKFCNKDKCLDYPLKLQGILLQLGLVLENTISGTSITFYSTPYTNKIF